MELLQWMSAGDCERMVAVQDRASGLRAWIALHHTERGPAYGGVRIWRYRSEGAAAADALRLAQAMTYKCVLAGIPGGGAKTVVLADYLHDRPAAMEALGREIEKLGGIYRSGPDVGFTEADGLAMGRGTRWLAHKGVRTGLRAAGEATAEGVLWGIRAALSHLGHDDLSGARVSVQGLGSVGLVLSRLLIDAGVTVIGSDLSEDACAAAKTLGVELVDPSQIFDVEADVFAPCAMGGILHDLSIQRLRVRAVAGAANNPLARDDHARLLADQNIVFVPDFVSNAGALIEGAGHEACGRTDWSNELHNIGVTVSSVLHRADADGRNPLETARHMAEEILEEEKKSRVVSQEVE
ncbi:MAG: amino acid dehydrogenase [Planctomycetes bacterium]|jgi:leucine dehydrogenase|nr:amino acid dehydrogenase [Planctomycetota bacterium]MBT4029543.1 amino acid dehydrogenase [Planctomycetota bacterium]MBT4560587.1 amino acid dehydrogenase [Planctomycetota bacterium]MBT5102122.1 amino acid dehydrogenase [Planctomycetota bacterium]MBT5120747.1 amino acid dehydrogenase [Planctomycetota bacterium]